MQIEALENGMCDVIKIRLKRRNAARSGKGNQPLNITTAVERPILKIGLPNFRCSFYFNLILVASLPLRRIFMMSHMPLSSASCKYHKFTFECVISIIDCLNKPINKIIKTPGGIPYTAHGKQIPPPYFDCFYAYFRLGEG